MTFEAYISNIRTKTGKAPKDFYDEAVRSGVLHPQTKAMEFVGWLKSSSGLGHGHAMAVWEAFRRQGWISPAPPRAATGRAKAARRGPDLKEAAK